MANSPTKVSDYPPGGVALWRSTSAGTPSGPKRRGPPGGGLSQVRRPGRRFRQHPRTGLLGQGPGADGPVRRHPGLYIRTLEDGIPESWEHVHYTRPEVDQAEAVITWHGELITSYAIQAASEKVTRLANETITMLRDKREKIQEDGTIPARAIIARMGKAELRTDATKREQVLDLLVSHRHLIPVARKGHYMMMVPHS